MIEPVANNANYQLARKLLDASVLRHEAIASNIANVETPGYRRVDLAPDFQSALRAQFAGGVAPAAGAVSAVQPALAQDASVRSVRADGNSVELENELGIEFSGRDEDTIGGVVTTELGRLPRVGDRVELGPLRFHVVEVDRSRVKTLIVVETARPPATPEP